MCVTLRCFIERLLTNVCYSDIIYIPIFNGGLSMKSKFAKILSLSMVVVMLLTALVACTGSGDGNGRAPGRL